MQNQSHIKIDERLIEVKVVTVSYRSGDYFIIDVPDLEICAYARNRKGVQKRVNKEIEIFFKHWTGNNLLFDRLKNLGWHTVDHEVYPPEELNISLPREATENNKYQIVYKELKIAA